ncbi:hypothetical protein HIM_04459 [Hirsutella minnesotensis 3608]|uniref:Up-regulated in Daf-2 domain-containing protein n=1 Tax=Hirsutella minnesotensis 3608 TaxID=1043627 RepID=A0A0F7ZV51_9HYPO|nr:hypothetical protein HIM_04459 [Hirsutella minnesotensis 3608]
MFDWPVIKPGETTSTTSLVDYHTGFATTGQDWWFISWYNEDGTKLYYSSPNNFRGFIDVFEKAAPTILAQVSKTAAKAGAVAAGTGPFGAILAGKAASTLAKATAKLVFNDESTVGFKKHYLTDKDNVAHKGFVTITINKDMTMEIASPSGTSKTVYKLDPKKTFKMAKKLAG